MAKETRYVDLYKTSEVSPVYTVGMNNVILNEVFKDGKANNTEVFEMMKVKYPEVETRLVYHTIANKIHRYRKVYNELEELYGGKLGKDLFAVEYYEVDVDEEDPLSASELALEIFEDSIFEGKVISAMSPVLDKNDDNLLWRSSTNPKRAKIIQVFEVILEDDTDGSGMLEFTENHYRSLPSKSSEEAKQGTLEFKDPTDKGYLNTFDSPKYDKFKTDSSDNCKAEISDKYPNKTNNNEEFIYATETVTKENMDKISEEVKESIRINQDIERILEQSSKNHERPNAFVRLFRTIFGK